MVYFFLLCREWRGKHSDRSPYCKKLNQFERAVSKSDSKNSDSCQLRCFRKKKPSSFDFTSNSDNQGNRENISFIKSFFL